MYAYAVSGISLYVSPLIHPFLYTWKLPKFKKHYCVTVSPILLQVQELLIVLKTTYNLNNKSENNTDMTNIGTEPVNCRLWRFSRS